MHNRAINAIIKKKAGGVDMCDTIGIYTSEKTFFAKNSDRSPNEPQLLEYHAPHSAVPKQRTTYLTIDGAHANAVLLSRPAWMWGAEMGVNEHGLAIGNEAVFTKGSYQKTGLTGMDLLRLALERADGVDSAIDVITSLLKRYGQGGDCGYDHSFFYDNSFLLVERPRMGGAPPQPGFDLQPAYDRAGGQLLQ